jgi:hypothetical protein
VSDKGTGLQQVGSPVAIIRDAEIGTAAGQKPAIVNGERR